MTDPSSPEDTPSKQDKGKKPPPDGAAAESRGTDRRELLNQLKNAAIAGPVLLTLKSFPAMAQEALSAGSAGSNQTNGI